MKRYLSLGIAIAFLITVSCVYVIAAEKTETKSPTSIEKKEMKVEKKETTIEKKEMKKVEGIEILFKKADDSFLKKDNKSAATDIKKTANYLKSQAVKDTDTSKNAITASAQELEKLAVNVEKGTVTSAEKLQEAFYNASYTYFS